MFSPAVRRWFCFVINCCRCYVVAVVVNIYSIQCKGCKGFPLKLRCPRMHSVILHLFFRPFETCETGHDFIRLSSCWSLTQKYDSNRTQWHQKSMSLCNVGKSENIFCDSKSPHAFVWETCFWGIRPFAILHYGFYKQQGLSLVQSCIAKHSIGFKVSL